MARTYLVFGDIEEARRVGRQMRALPCVRRLIEKYGRNANMVDLSGWIDGGTPLAIAAKPTSTTRTAKSRPRPL